MAAGRPVGTPAARDRAAARSTRAALQRANALLRRRRHDHASVRSRLEGFLRSYCCMASAAGASSAAARRSRARAAASSKIIFREPFSPEHAVPARFLSDGAAPFLCLLVRARGRFVWRLRALKPDDLWLFFGVAPTKDDHGSSFSQPQSLEHRPSYSRRTRVADPSLCNQSSPPRCCRAIRAAGSPYRVALSRCVGAPIAISQCVSAPSQQCYRSCCPLSRRSRHPARVSRHPTRVARHARRETCCRRGRKSRGRSSALSRPATGARPRARRRA